MKLIKGASTASLVFAFVFFSALPVSAGQPTELAGARAQVNLSLEVALGHVRYNSDGSWDVFFKSAKQDLLGACRGT